MLRKLVPLSRLGVIGICISTLWMPRVLGWTGARITSCLFLPFRGTSPSLLKHHTSGIRSGRLAGGTSGHSPWLVPRCSISDTRDAMDFRVVTYNILCSHLADQQRFPLCDPSNLDAPTRLERVKQKLEGEVAEGAVICLQEVSITWAGDLHVFFLSRGYAFVAAHYGAYFNNYMGVALAWPLDKFEALKVDITRVSETRKWGRDPALDAERKRPSPVPSTEWGGPLGVLMKLTGMGEGGTVERGGGMAGNCEREPEDPWRMAEKRFNQALFARLRRKGSTSAANDGVFCVGTYHMPCLFNFPQVMVMHTSMVIKHLTRLAGSDPLVFGGDFNFNPSSECYKLVTEGDLSSSSPEFPEVPEWEKRWSPETGVRLLSAYKEVEGQEPNFTNNAKVEDYEPFIDTLDYIFHTSGVTATKVLPLKHRDEVEGPFPTREEPSDHVLIAAEYTITGPKAAM